METLRRVVTVDAGSEREARRRVSDAWQNGEIILDCEDIAGAEFCVLNDDEDSSGKTYQHVDSKDVDREERNDG